MKVTFRRMSWYTALEAVPLTVSVPVPAVHELVSPRFVTPSAAVSEDTTWLSSRRSRPASIPDEILTSSSVMLALSWSVMVTPASSAIFPLFSV